MNTRSTILLSLLAAVLAPSVGSAQNAAALKKELKTRETKLQKTDATGYVELARWAREKGLLKDYKRLLEAAIKADPDHEDANTELGMVKVEGEWVTRAKAEVMRQKALDAAMKEKGMSKVDGVWVEAAHVDDAKQGVFWHDGDRVSKYDKLEFIAGKVRHPKTGEFILPEDLEKAQSGMFPTAEGRWLDEKAADDYHADRNRPWLVRTEYGTLASTLPFAKIQEFMQPVDSAIEAVLPVFLMKHVPPSHRPVIFIAEDTDQYREFGNEAGGGGSAYGAFLSEELFDIPGIGQCHPTFFNNLENWGEYYVKHAAALAFANGHCRAGGIEAPPWFLRGCGSLAERFEVPGHAKHFAGLHVEKGGVRSLKSFFSAFDINGGMESREIDYNIFQAGLVLNFAMKGGDADALKAMQAVSDAIINQPKKAVDAIEKLEKVVIAKEDGVKAHLQSLTR